MKCVLVAAVLHGDKLHQTGPKLLNYLKDYVPGVFPLKLTSQSSFFIMILCHGTEGKEEEGEVLYYLKKIKES